MVEQIILKNDIAEVSRIEDFLLHVCHGYELSERNFKSLNLAVEEWVVNVISYAYPEGTTPEGVELTADVNDGVLTLVIRDHGTAFDPTQQDEINIDAKLEERRIGGLGIHLVRTIMDTMAYERTADGYNVLTLTKKIAN